MGGGNGDSDSGSGGGGSDALVKVIGGGGHAQGHRGMGMGMHPMTRYATFLGPPHIVGAPTYIMGSPPVSGMPMYVPGGGQPMMMGAAAGAVSHRRRRRMREENADVSESVRKCVFVEENASTVELCAVMSAQSDLGVVLEYTQMSGEAMQRVREWNAKELAEGGTQFVRETRWRWTPDSATERECNDAVLAQIRGRVCIEKGSDGASVVALGQELQFGSDEQWDVVYDIESADGLHQKMCRFLDTAELCFELATELDTIEVTSHVL